MTRVATAAESSLILYYLQQNQSNFDNLNTEISTGLKAQTYSQIPAQTSQLVGYRTESSQQQGFMDTIDVLTTRLQTMDLSLQQIKTAVTSFRGMLPGGAFNPAQPDISAQAKLLMQQIAGFLNTQDGTRYLFGGTDTSTPPVNLSGLPTATANLTTPVNGPPSANGYYQGGPATAPVEINNQVSLNYGVTANDASAFEPIFRVLNFLANKGPFSANNPVDVANATTAGQILDQALSALTGLQGKLGLEEAQLNKQTSLLQDTNNTAQNGISNIVSVNQATAITQLQTLETQMQASFSSTNIIQKLSLANYLG